MNLDIVLVNYNSGPLLKHCLDSVLADLDGRRHRVLVIDNHSSDRSIAAAQAAHPAVPIVVNQANLGFARAVNMGIRRTHGPLILLLNPDTKVASGSLDKMVQFMANHPDCGVLGGLVLYPDGRRQETVRAFPTLSTVIFGRRTSLFYKLLPGNPLARKYLLLDRRFAESQVVDFVAGTFMMLRRKALDEVGLFDERYFMYVEDADLCYRMKEQGWRVYFTPDSRCTHLYGETFRTDNIHPQLHHANSMLRFFEKHYGPGWLMRRLLRAGVALKSMQVLAWTFFRHAWGL